MMIRTRIRKHEVGLWFRHDDFHDVLAPGKHWFWGNILSSDRDRVEIVRKLATKFEHAILDPYVKDARLAPLLEVVDLKDDERALVWKDGRLGWILGPGLHAFWKEPRKVEVEVFNVNDARFEHNKIEAILAHPAASQHLMGLRVDPQERVLLFIDGKLVDELQAGLHVYWKGAGKITWDSIDLREQVADVSGQEIMSGDKVTLRVNLVVAYQVTDPMKAISTVGDYAQALYREAQLALREAIGARQLDRLLADKDELGAEIANALRARASEYGVTVRSVGLRDVILPGDMKSILNEVILAQKQAEANLIRRREETAAARSQANTAKLLEASPALARMKELEALQDILKGSKATFVLGRGDIIEQVRALTNAEPDSAKDNGATRNP